MLKKGLENHQQEKGKLFFMSQRNQDRKKLETNAPTELWCPCWQICHPLALHTLYPPHVSPAFRLARTHFILKKKDRSISYSVKKQTKNSSEALRMLYYLYYVPFLTLLQQLPFLTQLPLHNLTIILSKSSGTRVSQEYSTVKNWGGGGMLLRKLSLSLSSLQEQCPDLQVCGKTSKGGWWLLCVPFSITLLQ